MSGKSGAASSLPMQQVIPQWSQRVWIMLVGALLLNSILRGIRAPDMWAYTHYLANYDYGFVKRGFQGGVISALHIPWLHSYRFAFWYMMAVFTADVLLLLWLMVRLCATDDLTTRLIASVFASSVAVLVLAHFVGSGDHVALLVTLLAIAIPGFYRRCIFVGVFFPLCLLIQETEFVIFFPVILFRFLIELGTDRTVQRRRLLSMSLVFMPVFITLIALSNTHMSEASATAMFHSIQSKTEYSLRDEYKIMLTTTFMHNVRWVIQSYSGPLMPRFVFLCWVATLPTSIYLMRRAWLQMTCNGYSTFLRVAGMVASVAPLTVHVIAFDGNRFAAFALLNSFLVYTTVRLQGGLLEVSVSAPTSNLLLPVALIAMNLSSSIPLYNGYDVRNFPYEELLHDLNDTLTRKQPFPPRAEQCSITGMCYFMHADDGGAPHSALSKTDICSNKQWP